jgi:hypothetical protein
MPAFSVACPMNSRKAVIAAFWSGAIVVTSMFIHHSKVIPGERVQFSSSHDTNALQGEDILFASFKTVHHRNPLVRLRA